MKTKGPRIVTLSGKAESGKTTAANMIKDYLSNLGFSVEILNNADYLKEILVEQYNWDGIKDKRGRELLQTVGDKCKGNNKDFFVDYLIDSATKGKYQNKDFLIVGDCRYENEIDKWISEGFDVTSLYIERVGHENKLTEQQRKHSSESIDLRSKCSFIIKAENLPSLTRQIADFIIRSRLNYGKLKQF